VLRQREAIRHPGDVVADGASFALLSETRHHVHRQLSGILPIGPEEPTQDALGPLTHLEHPRMGVEIDVEEILEISLIRLNYLGKSDEKRRSVSHLCNRIEARQIEPPQGS